MANHNEASSLVRQWILLRALCSRRRGATVRELVEELEVCERTVRRDLSALKTAGFPVKQETGSHGRKTFRIDERAAPPSLSFRYDEALALYMGRRFLDPLAGTYFFDAAHSAFRKIRAALANTALDYLDRVSSHIHQTTHGSSNYAGKGDIIDALLLGVEECRHVFIAYQSLRSTEPTTYPIYPYGFTFHHGSLYIVGFSPDHNQRRTWKIDRMESAEITQFRFMRPANFNLADFMANSFGVWDGDRPITVRIRFAASAARFVQEKHWHHTQRFKKQKDGSLTMEFTVTNTTEVKSWVLSFGKTAVVLAPKELRAEIVEELQSSLREYGEKVEFSRTQ